MTARADLQSSFLQRLPPWAVGLQASLFKTVFVQMLLKQCSRASTNGKSEWFLIIKDVWWQGNMNRNRHILDFAPSWSTAVTYTSFELFILNLFAAWSERARITFLTFSHFSFAAWSGGRRSTKLPRLSCEENMIHYLCKRGIYVSQNLGEFIGPVDPKTWTYWYHTSLQRWRKLQRPAQRERWRTSWL